MVTFHHKWKYGKVLSVLLLLAMATVAITLFVLPYDYFDHGQAMCMSKLLFDIECYGCGMTRACMRLIHGRVEEAMMFNKLSLLVFPCLTYLSGLQINMEVKNILGKLDQPNKSGQ